MTQDSIAIEINFCHVCYADADLASLIEVRDIHYPHYGERHTPCYICRDCAMKISNAVKESNFDYTNNVARLPERNG
jgi:hypothetical protein